MAERTRLVAMPHPTPELAESPPYYWQEIQAPYDPLEGDGFTSEMDLDVFELDFGASEMDIDDSETSFEDSEMDLDNFAIDFDALPRPKRQKKSRLDCLRRDTDRGLVPPYCATSPALFRRSAHALSVQTGLKAPHNRPTPLRKVVTFEISDWPPTGALEASPSYPLAAPGPSYPGLAYDADGGSTHGHVDCVGIPARLAGIVRRDYFDKQPPVEHEFRYLEEEGHDQAYLNRHWRRMSTGNGITQVVKYEREALPPYQQLCRPRSPSDSTVSPARSRGNWFRDPHTNEPRRILFRKSIEFEGEDLSEIIDKNIRRARRAEGRMRIRDRRVELQQDGWQLYESSTKPGSFMKYLRERSEKIRILDKKRELERRPRLGAEPSLDGLLSWQARTDPAAPSSETLSNQYAVALSLWPSRYSKALKLWTSTSGDGV